MLDAFAITLIFLAADRRRSKQLLFFPRAHVKRQRKGVQTKGGQNTAKNRLSRPCTPACRRARKQNPLYFVVVVLLLAGAAGTPATGRTRGERRKAKPTRGTAALAKKERKARYAFLNKVYSECQSTMG